MILSGEEVTELMGGKIRKRNGFTLFELITIVIILGIIATAALPHYFDLVEEAEASHEKGVIAGVRAGIAIYFARNKQFPPALDSAILNTCDLTNPCFDNVLGQGAITDNWIKAAADQYQGPTATTYTYNPADGSFI